MNSSIPDFFGTEDNVGINLLEVDVEAGQVLRQDGPESKIKAKRGRPRKYNTPEEKKAASDNRHLRCRQSKTQSEADEKFRQKGVKEVNEDLKQKYSKTIKKNKFLFKKYSETFYSSPNLNLLWNEPDEIEAYQIQIQNLENSCLSKVENLNYKNFDNACQKSREKKDLIKTKDEKTSEILGKLNKLYQIWLNDINSINQYLEEKLLMTGNINSNAYCIDNTISHYSTDVLQNQNDQQFLCNDSQNSFEEYPFNNQQMSESPNEPYLNNCSQFYANPQQPYQNVPLSNGTSNPNNYNQFETEQPQLQGSSVELCLNNHPQLYAEPQQQNQNYPFGDFNGT